MAINGVTESFISSVATTRDLARQSRAMIVFTGIFLGVAWGLLSLGGLGGEGLVWANCVNLGIRIIWSIWFITRWYKINGDRGVGWRRVGLKRGTATFMGMIALGLKGLGIMGWLDGFLESVGVVGVCALVLFGGLYYPSPPFSSPPLLNWSLSPLFVCGK